MAIKFGFFNSVGGDRTYDAVDVSSMFEGVLTDGVFETIGDKLETIAGTGMQVVVGTGKAWFNKTWTLNDSDLALVIQPSDLILPRLDAVILEVDSSNAVRANTIKVLTGTPNASPVLPTLTNTTEVHQYYLASVAVDAGVTTINLTDIINMVGTIYCPYVMVPQSTQGDVSGVLKIQIFS